MYIRFVMQKTAIGGVLKKDVPKNFENFIGKHLSWSLFLIKLQACRSLLKGDSNTRVFL